MKANLEQLVSKLEKTPSNDSSRIEVKKVYPDLAIMKAKTVGASEDSKTSGRVMLVDRESGGVMFSFCPRYEWSCDIGATLDILDNTEQILINFIDWLGCDEI